MRNNKTYIICSAIHFINDTISPHQPKNIDKGIVICGRRHHNIYSTLASLGLERLDFTNNIQGFLTNDDKFVNREEAAIIAKDAGQIKDKVIKLFSEDLY
jgi:hypothetical protein